MEGVYIAEPFEPEPEPEPSPDISGSLPIYAPSHVMADHIRDPELIEFNRRLDDLEVKLRICCPDITRMPEAARKIQQSLRGMTGRKLAFKKRAEAEDLTQGWTIIRNARYHPGWRDNDEPERRRRRYVSDAPEDRLYNRDWMWSIAGVPPIGNAVAEMRKQCIQGSCSGFAISPWPDRGYGQLLCSMDVPTLIREIEGECLPIRAGAGADKDYVHIAPGAPKELLREREAEGGFDIIWDEIDAHPPLVGGGKRRKKFKRRKKLKRRKKSKRRRLSKKRKYSRRKRKISNRYY